MVISIKPVALQRKIKKTLNIIVIFIKIIFDISGIWIDVFGKNAVSSLFFYYLFIHRVLMQSYHIEIKDYRNR